MLLLSLNPQRHTGRAVDGAEAGSLPEGEVQALTRAEVRDTSKDDRFGLCLLMCLPPCSTWRELAVLTCVQGELTPVTGLKWVRMGGYEVM